MSWPTTMRPPAAPTTRTNAAPTRARHLLVELVGHDAADVVRLDDAGQVATVRTRRAVSQPAPSGSGAAVGSAILRVLSSTRSTGSGAAVRLEPGAVLAAVAGGELDRGAVGEGHARRVTRSLPQARHVTPARAPGWVSEPSGTWVWVCLAEACLRVDVREAVLVRAIRRSAFEEDDDGGGDQSRMGQGWSRDEVEQTAPGDDRYPSTRARIP